MGSANAEKSVKNQLKIDQKSMKIKAIDFERF